eukprot:NODE_4824_length_637_cov_281.493127.p5 GENE.NODE_4824_length_637_cov_281.493127~~NODE_4824_length_637_cov_281.493127.p5  ORF type:complete len:53 (-),score=4.78 NODE_4824_length_637_cov_281.493127:278-436(-)
MVAHIRPCTTGHAGAPARALPSRMLPDRFGVLGTLGHAATGTEATQYWPARW